MSLSHDLSQLKTHHLANGLGQLQRVGYSAPLSIQLAAMAPVASSQGQGVESDRQQLYQLADQILSDPLAMRQLAEAVYQRLQRDLQQQRLRSRGYGG